MDSGGGNKKTQLTYILSDERKNTVISLNLQKSDGNYKEILDDFVKENDAICQDELSILSLKSNKRQRPRKNVCREFRTYMYIWMRKRNVRISQLCINPLNQTV